MKVTVMYLDVPEALFKLPIVTHSIQLTHYYPPI